jgi:hypothetical protein
VQELAVMDDDDPFAQWVYDLLEYQEQPPIPTDTTDYSEEHP